MPRQRCQGPAEPGEGVGGRGGGAWGGVWGQADPGLQILKVVQLSQQILNIV